LIGAVLRASRGIEVTEETLAFDVVRDVCTDGPGHFLGHGQTLGRMQSDYFYPATADRRTPQEWADTGSADLLDIARHKTADLLNAPCPVHIDDDLDAKIRARFPIHLSAAVR
ncbi:MAG: trimethylamine methyltransferase family protein, partial [Henriciella sp.]